MRKIEIVFVAIFVAMIVLSAVAAVLGETTHALFLNGMAVLSLIVFPLFKIEVSLSKIVSLLEIQAMGDVIKHLAKMKVDVETAQAVTKKAKQAKEELEKLKAEKCEPCPAPEQEQPTSTEEK